MKIGYGICNGTFGELVQGVINQQPFLVTLPIPILKSEAVFVPSTPTGKIISMPSNRKAVIACEMILQMFGLYGGGSLHLNSNIPRGKGMASSSADLVATLRAVADSYSIDLSQEIISYITSEIEPTDGVMYKGVVSYDYINGKLLDSFGTLPSFGILGLDLGGSIDTVQFNKQLKQYDKCDEDAILEAYELIKLGMKKRELSLICQAATMSAQVNEKILPKPYFKEIEKLTAICQGGIVVAHSGTMIGILFDPNIPNLKEFQFHVSQFIKRSKITPFYYCQLTH